MKKSIYILIIALISSTVGMAGVFDADTNSVDTSYIRLKNKTIMVVDRDEDEISENDTDTIEVDHKIISRDLKEEYTHYEGIDVGMNVLFNKNGGTTFEGDEDWLNIDYARSLTWNFNLFEGKIRLIKDNFGILTGAGLSYRSIGFKNSVALVKTDSTITGVKLNEDSISFTKNKLRATYAQVPLMFEINTNTKDHDRNFHLAFGVNAGLRIGSITKNKYELEGKKVKDRVKDDFHLADFTAEAVARVGYRNFTVWASYGLTPWFNKSKGPEVYMASAGIQLIGF